MLLPRRAIVIANHKIRTLFGGSQHDNPAAICLPLSHFGAGNEPNQRFGGCDESFQMVMTDGFSHSLRNCYELTGFRCLDAWSNG